MDVDKDMNYVDSDKLRAQGEVVVKTAPPLSGLEVDLDALPDDANLTDHDASSMPALNFVKAVESAIGAISGVLNASASQSNPHLNEDEQILFKVAEFNLQQAILRTKLRVKNHREEAIDFVAKVILMVFGLLPLELHFLTNEFRQSYMIYPALSVEQLERLMKEIADYERIVPDNAKFKEFWEAHRELCQLQLEKKRMSELMGISEDRLFKEDSLEAEGNEFLV